MTTDEVKEALLKKLFNEYLPEICKVDSLMNDEVNHLIWIDGQTEHSSSSINLHVNFNNDLTLRDIHCSLYTNRYSNEEPYEALFDNVQTTIKALKKRFDLYHILNLVEKSRLILENKHNNYTNKIKFILNIGKEIDLCNLEKRSVLFEKYKL